MFENASWGTLVVGIAVMLVVTWVVLQYLQQRKDDE